jgi:putative ubiquitin-RnfH superfamily antitoxin RatB of RatAB toxin-antitoxin module
MMKVEVVMAWPRRFESVTLELEEGATLGDALAVAQLGGKEDVNGYAIFGVNADAATPLREGDRVELLRPLRIDPKDARRRRAARPRA